LVLYNERDIGTLLHFLKQHPYISALIADRGLLVNLYPILYIGSIISFECNADAINEK